jgi:hypothetical protein
MHHLSIIGDNWEIFLMRNGFSQVDPIANPLLIPNPNLDEPEFIDKTPLDKGLLCASLE